MDILSDPNPLSREASTDVNSKNQHFQNFLDVYIVKEVRRNHHMEIFNELVLREYCLEINLFCD